LSWADIKTYFYAWVSPPISASMLRKKASALRQLLMSVLVRSLQPEEESGSVDRAAVEISKFAHALLQLVPLSRWLVAEEAPAVAHAVESAGPSAYRFPHVFI
jgi:hypothetical protein